MSTTQQSLEVAQQQSLDAFATDFCTLNDEALMHLALNGPGLWVRRQAILQMRHRGVIEGIDLACASSRKALAELQS